MQSSLRDEVAAEKGSVSAAIATAATRKPSLQTPKVASWIAPVRWEAAGRA